MFILRVHSVDTNHPLTLEETAFSPVSSATQSNPNPKYLERRGIVHLYLSATQSSLPSPNSRSTSVFVVAVPNYLSADDFIRFCGPYVDHVHELLFIRNDGMEDRYSVLIRLDNELTADGFYSNFNGKRFAPAEVSDLCFALFCIWFYYFYSMNFFVVIVIIMWNVEYNSRLRFAIFYLCDQWISQNPPT